MNSISAMRLPKNLLHRSIAVASAIALSLVITGCKSHLDMMPAGTVWLNGAQQVPPVDTIATGKGLFTVTSTKMITGNVTTDRINATAAHIHLAPRGSNGPVIVPLVKTGETTWTVAEHTRLTDTQYVQYVAGDFYVNVHSEAYPNGEIRGQLLAN